MERNIEHEMDEIKEQLKGLKELLTVKVQPENNSPEFVTDIRKMPNLHSDPSIMKILNNLENTCGTQGGTGRITYLGVFASGGRQSTWIQNEINTDELLGLIENHTAQRVLSCIGNNDRLNILLALLREPMTVASLVEKCGYNSTGQVYHHLKELISTDLVAEDREHGKGVYVVKSHRVQGIIMMLAGVNDIVDARYK